MNAFQELSDSMAAAVEKAAKSIVTVDARMHVPGTGIIWSADGDIVTAEHLLQRDEEIRVGLPDGRVVEATVAGRDPGSDLALLKVEATGLTPAEWLSLDALKVGQLVLAVGRPGDGVQATLGAVSALRRGRRLGAYVQTDVLMYPGFSGGPLVVPDGRVAGLNSSALARGASIALPRETVSAVAMQLKEHGQIKRGFVGVSSHPIRLAEAQAAKAGQTVGLIIQNVEPGSPAEKAGLFQGDILVNFDGLPTEGMDDLQSVLGMESVGKTVTVKVIRGGELKELKLTVGERE